MMDKKLQVRPGDVVSILSKNDQYPSVGRVVEVVASDDLALYTCKLLIDPGSDFLPYWISVDDNVSVYTLLVGENYLLSGGSREGENVRFLRLLQKAPTALVELEDGSDWYCPASLLRSVEQPDH